MSDCQHQSCGRTKDSVQTQRQQDPEKRERLLDALTDCLADVEKESDIEELERRLTELDPDEELAENFDVEQSLDEFYRKYPVLGSEVPAEAESSPVPQKKHSRLYRNFARTAIIAAVLCGSIVAAQANALISSGQSPSGPVSSSIWSGVYSSLRILHRRIQRSMIHCRRSWMIMELIFRWCRLFSQRGQN